VGAFGLLSMVIVQVTVMHRIIFLFDYGLWERLAVYPILAWNAVIGAWLLFGYRERGKLLVPPASEAAAG
jgi:hypothetical protein